MGYDRAWHPILAGVEARHPWFRARADLVSDMIRRYSGTSPSVLDAGCGTGWTSGEIAANAHPAMMVGVDLSVRQASSSPHPGVVLVQSDLVGLPFRDSFDSVLLLDVLEHFEDDGALLGSVTSVLRHDGLLVISVLAMPSLWSGYDERCGHCRRYSAGALRDLLSTRGFTPVYMTHFASFLAPVLFMHRRIAMISRAASASDAEEMQPGPLVSWASRLCFRVESMMIKAGISLPVGTSILAVARRMS